MNIFFRKQKQLLFIAAIINFAGSLPAIISPAYFFSQFFRTPPDPQTTFPYVAMYHYLFYGIGIIMGIAYWMAAMDPIKNKIVLLIGGLGKLLAISFWLMLFLQDQGKWLMMAGVIADGILGMVMLYLFFGKEKENIETN